MRPLWELVTIEGGASNLRKVIRVYSTHITHILDGTEVTR